MNCEHSNQMVIGQKTVDDLINSTEKKLIRRKFAQTYDHFLTSVTTLIKQIPRILGPGWKVPYRPGWERERLPRPEGGALHVPRHRKPLLVRRLHRPQHSVGRQLLGVSPQEELTAHQGSYCSQFNSQLFGRVRDCKIVVRNRIVWLLLVENILHFVVIYYLLSMSTHSDLLSSNFRFCTLTPPKIINTRNMTWFQFYFKVKVCF